MPQGPNKQTFRGVINAQTTVLINPGIPIAQIRVARVGIDPVTYPVRLGFGLADSNPSDVNQGDVINFPYGARLTEGLVLVIPTTDTGNNTYSIDVILAGDT